MSKKDSGGPVYPDNYYYDAKSKTIAYSSGIGRRDWLAGMALAMFRTSDYSLTSDIAKKAYRVADAMIAESRKEAK